MNPTPSQPERPEPTLQDMEDARNGENTCNHQSLEYCRSRFSCTRTAGHSGPHIGLGATPTPYWYEDGDIFPELYRVATRTPAPEAVAGEVDGYFLDGKRWSYYATPTPPADKDAEIARFPMRKAIRLWMEQNWEMPEIQRSAVVEGLADFLTNAIADHLKSK